MDAQTMQDELAAGQDVLRTASTAHLAYTTGDGTPRVAPVGFWWTGEQFVVATATTAPKVRSLSAHPDIALTVDSTSGPARSLSVRGRADLTVVDGVVEEYLLAARAHASDDASYEQFAAGCRAMYPQMARIAITPTWARFYDFGVGRFPKFLADLAAKAGG